MPLARTNLPPEEQVRNILVYDDQVAAGSSMETTNGTLENNIQAVLSQINRGLNGIVTGNNWYVDPPTPTGFEGASVRGTIDLNQDLHDLERKRVLRLAPMVGVDVPDPGVAQVVILGAGDLPTTTTAAIGSVTTLGTVVATATVFGTASAADVVAGANALEPRNLLVLTDATTGRLVTRASDSRQVFGLFQSESAVDGSTITVTTPNRVQISFVVHNATNDGLELIAAGDMDGIAFDYAYVERLAFEDVPEEAWIGNGFAEFGGGVGTAATRNFFQDTFVNAVAPGNTINAADLTGGVLPVKPSTGFSFDLDAAVYLNGIFLVNGAGNEVASGAGNTINLEIGAPGALPGDVLTVVYHTNSTNNTA